MSASDDPITSFNHRGIEVRRIVLETGKGPQGDLTITWAWKAMVEGDLILGETMEDAIRRINARLDSPGG